MKTIYKYKLILEDRQQVRLPMSARFLSVQLQHGELTMWCLIDTEDICGSIHSVGNKFIYIYGTGQEVTCSDSCHFLGTVQQGNLVLHLFSPTLQPYTPAS